MSGMDSFPAYFPLAGRRIVIVGADEQAEGKARLFEGSPAHLVRIDDGRALDPETYRGAALVFISGEDEAFARLAAQAAKEAGAPVNVVDRPELCDFFTPALVDRGEVVAAVGTGGASPVLAQMLKQKLEEDVPEGAGRLAALLRQYRDAVRQAFPVISERAAFVRAQLDGPAARAALEGDMETARRLLAQALEAAKPS
jgi:precorrin-2 dehydrogenase/sirohydrochlorin ferrochelatase